MISDQFIESKGFKRIDGKIPYEWERPDLTASGWTLRWVEALHGHFIEPTIRPTTRINVDTEERLEKALELLGDSAQK